MRIQVAFQMVRQLFELLDKKQRKTCIVVLFLMFSGSWFELLGVTAILPYLEVIMSSNIMEKWYVRTIVKVTKTTSENQILLILGLIIILIYWAKNAYLLLLTYVQNKFSYKVQKELSVKMLSFYLSRPYTYFLNINSADILRGINEDIAGVYACLVSFFRIVVELVSAVLIAAYILASDFYMALGIILLVSVCLLGVTFGFKKKLNYMGVERRKAQAEGNKFAYQAITGIKEITVMQRKSAFIKNYEDTTEIRRKAETTYGFFAGCPNRITEAVCVSGMLLTVTGRVIFGVNIESFIPRLGVFAVAAFKLLPAVSNVSSCIAGLMYNRSALQATYDNFIEIERNRMNQKHFEQEKDQRISETKSFSQIDLANVFYKYPMSSENVIEDLSIGILRGESVAFIGESGAGKTTLADIILGLLKPQAGQVTCDGKNIFEMPVWWSHMIGYVPQAVFLIDDTIRNNILFGVLEDEADDEKVWDALEQAQLKDFVCRLPDGLNTVVGERGVKLSGGQRQRIAIARVLYYNPQILVLDEATSALDTETENDLMEAIEELQGKKTLIIVAHRLTTIRNCDKIYEIRNGKACVRSKEEVFEKEFDLNE